KARAGWRKAGADRDGEIDELVRGHRRQLLEHGAAGQLAVGGEVELLLLEDEEALARARPVGPDGTVTARCGRRASGGSAAGRPSTSGGQPGASRRSPPGSKRTRALDELSPCHVCLSHYGGKDGESL